jgi:hypothetical protein
LQRLQSLYGIPSGSLKLLFEGDRLTSDQTPQDLDLEEDDVFLVDAKIDPKLYDKAVQNAQQQKKK